MNANEVFVDMIKMFNMQLVHDLDDTYDVW